MSPVERLRQILPFAMALYLAGSVAQFQATRPTFPPTRLVVTAENIVSGLKWHMLQIARNEQAEMFIGFPGN